MIYVVDLDDILVSSTKLNNDAYNFALEKYNFPRINTVNRITRETIANINCEMLQKIIKEKQKYFSLEWLPYRLVLNKNLIDKLKTNKRQNCYLWSKANKERTLAILKSCKLENLFETIIFDQKFSFDKSICKIKKIAKSNNFIIYENNHNFFQNQNVKEVDKIKNRTFDVIGYQIFLVYK